MYAIPSLFLVCEQLFEWEIFVFNLFSVCIF